MIQNVQRPFSCLIGFTFHEIKINDLPESSSDHTSISTHLKEWCDLLRIFLHPLPYFPCKINKEIHLNFLLEKYNLPRPICGIKRDRTQNQTRNTTVLSISKTKEQMDNMSTVTDHLAANQLATK